MVPAPAASFHVRLEVHDAEVPVHAVEINGNWAALRGSCPLRADDEVRLHLAWASGRVTTLPGRVHSTAQLSPSEHLAQVELRGVEGDWGAFLAFLGPLLLGGAAA